MPGVRLPQQTPSKGSIQSNEEWTDPDLRYDRLPQPYRFIDKVISSHMNHDLRETGSEEDTRECVGSVS